MTWWKRKDTVSWKRKHRITPCGELTFDETMTCCKTDNKTCAWIYVAVLSCILISRHGHILSFLSIYLYATFGTQVHGFKHGQSHQIFQGKKILSTPSFRNEVKPFVPCRIFAACKRTQKCTRGSRSFRSKLPAFSHPSSSSFHY